MNKVVFVQANFAFRGKEIKHGEIDGERLTKDLQEAIARLNNEGYEIVSATSITSGCSTYKTEAGRSYGYGYSYTEGAIILARKI